MNFRDFIATAPTFTKGDGMILAILVPVLVLWTLIWKGLALWRAAKRDENAWFIALLIFNTLGILEIIYYFLIAKKDKK